MDLVRPKTLLNDFNKNNIKNIPNVVIEIDTSIYPIGYGVHIWPGKPGKDGLNNKQILAGWLINKGVPEEDIIIRDQSRAVYCKKFSETNEAIVCLQEIPDKICRQI